jgi:NAD(P)-dependent dehydrogenase (short-subunit alcohol dehydrogenase family)
MSVKSQLFALLHKRSDRTSLGCVRMNTDLSGKVAIVTGGNTGIGKETARGLAQRGATVVIASRDASKAEAARADIAATTANPNVTVLTLDLASKDSVRAFVARFEKEHDRLDILVDNAGLWPTTRTTTKDGFETTFGVNHLGTFLLTRELLPLLERSAAHIGVPPRTPSRIVILSSSLHYRGKLDWGDLMFERRKYSGQAAYNQSKLANVLFTKALARRLDPKKVTVNAVHPGVVATELSRDFPKLLVKVFNLFLLTPAKGAACSLYVATSPELDGVTGLYFEKSKAKEASKAALDTAAQDKLYDLSETLLGLSPTASAAA